MAKKRKEEDEYEFVAPPFSEKQYIEKDLRDSKIVIFTTIYGIIAGALASLLSVYVNPALGFFFILLFLILLFRFFYRLLKVDFSTFKSSDYVFKGGTYLITAIAIWILLFNPPFAYITPPVFHGQVPVTLQEKSSSGWISYNLSATPVISPGFINITAWILAVGPITVNLYLSHNASVSIYHMARSSPNHYTYQGQVSSGSYSFRITATTASGIRTRSAEYGFTVA